MQLAGRFSDQNVGYHNLPLGDPLAEAATVGWSNPEDVAIHYLELLLSSDDSIGEALAVLTDPAAYPAVIHCSVGKDRTGILVALVLSLVGVADDDVVADYALSGMGAVRLALRLRELGADNPSDLDRFLPALLSAEPDTMRRFPRAPPARVRLVGGLRRASRHDERDRLPARRRARRPRGAGLRGLKRQAEPGSSSAEATASAAPSRGARTTLISGVTAT